LLDDAISGCGFESDSPVGRLVFNGTEFVVLLVEATFDVLATEDDLGKKQAR
jgi:hypothetical protein